MKKAWEGLITQFDIFRTGFYGEGLSQFLQVVYQKAELPWISIEWKAISEGEYNLRLTELQLKGRQEGFDVEKAPLFKLVWIEKSTTEFHLIWTHHHMLLDGWCLPIVMQQLLSNYQAIKEGKPIPRLAIPPYKTYIAWLARQDKKAALQWWQQEIQTLEHPLCWDLKNKFKIKIQSTATIQLF